MIIINMGTEYFEEILSHVIINWDMIIEMDNIYEAVNMRNNSLCREMKRLYPSMMDQMIQAYVFSLLIFMFYTMYQSVQNNANTTD